MSVNKYANLPDIDTAPDVYETEDVFPISTDNKGDSSEDEANVSRSHGRGKNVEPGKDELDPASLLSTDEASRKFRKAERRQHRPRIQYTYPPSPTSPTSPTSLSVTPPVPLSRRIRLLQAELASIETELADPSNPLLKQEKEVEPGDLIRSMVDVKGRLEKISKLKEGRGKLVSVVLGEEEKDEADKEKEGKSKPDSEDGVIVDVEEKARTPDVKDFAEMDRRVGEMEKIIGSSTTTLDELTPLPHPLLPLLTRLYSQLTLLTQPRHIDSISRRLKLLLSDLERVSNANSQQHGGQRRQPSHTHAGLASPHPSAAPAPAVPVSTLQDQLTPILTRLAPLLPHIPHVLTRLRTLSALHTSAASFESNLEGLEEEQRKGRAAFEELERAVQGVEASLQENENVVKTNVKEIEERVDNLGRRIEELHAKS